MARSGPDLLLPQDAPEGPAAERGPDPLVPPSLRDRALLLPIAGFLLAMPPLVGIFSRDVLVLGVPLLYLYLFGLWCLLIVGGALIARRLQAHDSQPGGPAPAPRAAPAPDDPPEGSADAR